MLRRIKLFKISKFITCSAVLVIILFGTISFASVCATSNTSTRIDSKVTTYIFISFSMSDAALKDYFTEAESLGAKLIVRGLVNDSFQETTAIANSLAIRFDIDPNLFEQYGVTVVPTIVVDDGIRPAKKLTGHLPLAKALEIMQEEKEQ